MKIQKNIGVTLTILILSSLVFGCLGNDTEDQVAVSSNNVSTVVVKEQSDASFWEMMYWTSMWHNSFYMPYYYHVYTPCYGFVYHTTPAYRPVYVSNTVTRNVYQVKDSKGTVLYKSTDSKKADNYRYRAAQRYGSGSGSNYKQTVSTNDKFRSVKNVNSGYKPSTWKDNSNSVKSMRSTYKSSGYRSSSYRSSSFRSSGRR
jgi:hypothetical protein